MIAQLMYGPPTPKFYGPPTPESYGHLTPEVYVPLVPEVLEHITTLASRTPPPDSDGDGIADPDDHCPNTPKGALVDSMGCPSDEDGDAVLDGIDRCPGTPESEHHIVDAFGCTIDADSDGVHDGLDDCPETPSGATVSTRGCPSDEDGDGVFDGLDQCPGTPSFARMVVDAAGCPLDTDRDGVPDYLDYCPDTPPQVEVTKRGCPPDTDGDGVPNMTDRCPDTPKGLEVDATGCLVMTQLDRRLILHVSYVPGTTAPDRLSLRVLDDVAVRLRDAPDVQVLVEGFTDNIGLDSANLEVSQKRADRVKDYLVGRGIPAERIESIGRGETDFIANNATAAGRQRNRRIEMSFHRLE